MPYNLHVVEDGESALRFLRHQSPFADAPSPHFMILDLNLPGLDGRGVLKEMRADSSLPPTPVIVLTTSTSREDICQMHRLGANCFLTKPATLDEYFELMKGVEEFWGRRVRLPVRC